MSPWHIPFLQAALGATIALALETPAISVVFARIGESAVVLRAPPGIHGVRWFRLSPDMSLHDNSIRIYPYLDSIRYTPTLVGTEDSLPAPTDSLGTRTYAWCRTDEICPWIRGFATAELPQSRLPDRATQVAIRLDDSYPGILTELLQTPFVLLPRKVGTGHQTDLRIGSDCAALAAYGRRRMGEAVPYLGPRGLLSSLVSVARGDLRAGDILHYGAQVQVVFEDRGRKGFPDGEDLVIESWHPFPRIVRQDSSGWEDSPYRVMRFASDTGSNTAARALRDPVGLPLGTRRPARCDPK
ncbi:MAG: hypothetical protein IPN71_03555 [Fibrobacteres bacterium]|nr:hypothetical protein [Fibrobacterota bacterium]